MAYHLLPKCGKQFSHFVMGKNTFWFSAREWSIWSICLSLHWARFSALRKNPGPKGELSDRWGCVWPQRTSGHKLESWINTCSWFQGCEVYTSVIKQTLKKHTTSAKAHFPFHFVGGIEANRLRRAHNCKCGFFLQNMGGFGKILNENSDPLGCHKVHHRDDWTRLIPPKSQCQARLFEWIEWAHQGHWTLPWDGCFWSLIFNEWCISGWVVEKGLSQPSVHPPKWAATFQACHPFGSKK